jgi:hypothetical protein
MDINYRATLSRLNKRVFEKEDKYIKAVKACSDNHGKLSEEYYNLMAVIAKKFWTEAVDLRNIYSIVFFHVEPY